MKKVFSIIALGAMTLSLSSFDIIGDTSNNVSLIILEDCDENYRELKEFAISNGASESEAENAAGDYWVNCVNNGGESEVMEIIKRL